MSHLVSIELSDNVYESLRSRAEAAGTSTERLLAASVERQYGQPSRSDESQAEAAQGQFEHCEELDRGEFHGVDGLPIDADFAREHAGEAARGKFRRGFGSIDLGAPIGLDNGRIDADLAGEYGDDHEDA